ncbi:MAG: flagellar motor protein MotA [Alphaproteobacteria bacterium]|nr:flagellar motor protein MotA [Alphaproteobacteria bacterium]
MTHPRRYLTRMAIFLLLAAAAVAALYAQLLASFMANPFINGVIVFVLAFGILYVFRQVWMLNVEVNWIETYRSERPGLSVAASPRLLAPMATMFGERSGRLSLSTMSLRSILDGISSRLDESRDLSRYLIGLLIFLGLLGTFWGLLQTVRSVAGVIAGLQVTGGDVTEVFDSLKQGLNAPLAGMGTAFSSSLFGLAGSLILGFLDLQAGAAQNRFYNELEEWLSGQTRVSSGAGGIIEGDHSVPAYIQALLENTADSLDNLQRTIAQGEATRGKTDVALTVLADGLTTLTDQMRTEQDLMLRLAQSQNDMQPVLQKLAEGATADTTGAIDEATRSHIRNVDIYLARLVEESSSGRTQMVQELRAEIRLLARTIAASSDEGDGRR